MTPSTTTPGALSSELLAQLETFAQRSRLPAVRALHLPTAELAGTREGEFCALELEDGSIGLSYILLDDTLQALMASGSAPLAGADAMALARKFDGGSSAERALALAAINALSRCFFSRAGFVPTASTDSIGMLAPVPDDHIGMIGLFTPLLRKILDSGARLTVLELKAHLAGQGAGYEVTLDAEALRSCNKILSTSTVLLNDTLDRVLANCSGASEVAMIGPSAGCLPDGLYARGVTLVGGTWIVDPPAFVTALRAGEPWSAHARKFALRREDYPGFAALLARL